MGDIVIDYGVYTNLTVDLADIDFEKEGIKQIVFTIKNWNTVENPPIIERFFDEGSGVYGITITPEESLKIKDKGALYDFNKILADNRRYKISENGRVIIRRGVGDAID